MRNMLPFTTTVNVPPSDCVMIAVSPFCSVTRVPEGTTDASTSRSSPPVSASPIMLKLFHLRRLGSRQFTDAFHHREQAVLARRAQVRRQLQTLQRARAVVFKISSAWFFRNKSSATPR